MINFDWATTFDTSKTVHLIWLHPCHPCQNQSEMSVKVKPNRSKNPDLYPKIAIFKRDFVHAKKCIFFIWSFSKMLHTKFVFLSGPIMNPKLLELAQIILKWKSLGWNFIFIIYNFKLLSSLIWLHNHVIFLSVFSVASFWNTQIATKTIR